MSVDGFVPRRDREHAEKVEALVAGLSAALEERAHVIALGSIALAAGELDRRRAENLTRALEEAMGAIVDFDERAGAGDVAGAAMALRGWLERVRA